MAMDPEELRSPVLYSMKKRGVPITRENFIRENWHPVPDPWTIEDEAELPEELQDFSVFPNLKP